GGCILFVESTTYPGKGTLRVTGQLGDVMKESAQAAISLIRSRGEKFGISPTVWNENDLHIHVPEGAVPKDGPSAGVTMVTSLVSLLTNRRVRKEVAMTGEITLRGLVLPIGGLKEKVLAAKRAGITEIIIPWENKRDLVAIPKEAQKGLTFYPAKTIDDVLEVALEPK
ncbi:MAG: endopeptidase La, partial [Phycisphaerales bacterium]|nr:endopeptidase La [Phycisphaerales bacterium]